MSNHYNKEVVKKFAEGRIIEILEQVAGISHEFLLGNRPVEGEYHNGPCPKCGGTDRFRLINKEAGAVLCNQCFNTGNGDFLGAVQWMKGCSFPEAIDLVGKYLESIGVLSDSSPNWHGRDLYGEKQSYVEAVYHYPDRMGKPAYKIERFRKPDGGKWFCQWRWFSPFKKWVKGLGGLKVLPYPYNLKSLNKNIKALFIVEGEKCVDAINQVLEGTPSHGRVAVTTVAGGCQQWQNLGDLLEPYRPDCPVYFLVDNDECGEKAVQEGFESLFYADRKYVSNPGEKTPYNRIYQKTLPSKRPNTIYYRVDFPTPVDPERDPRGYDVADFLEDLTRQGCSKEDLYQKLNSYIKENKKIMTEEFTPEENELMAEEMKEFFDATVLSDVKAENIQWVWENKIALGMLTLLAGRGGEGKSYFSAYLASQISRGGVWPDGTPVDRGCTIFLGPGEDPLPQIIRPRLETLSADLSLISEFRGAFSESENTMKKKMFPASLKKLYLLEDYVHYMKQKTGFPVKMVVIDPVSSFLDGTQENNNAEIRELLKPLVCFAKDENIAVLLISHFRKSAGERGSSAERVIGSAAFTTAVRAVWFLYADRANRSVKMVVPAKGNILIQPTGLEFQLLEDGRLEFTNPFLRKTADDIDAEQIAFLRQQEMEADKAMKKETKKRSQGRVPVTREAAEEWIISILQNMSNGRAVTEIMSEAKDAGFSPRTIRRAASKLKLKREKMLTGWTWTLSEIPVSAETHSSSEALATPF